MLILKGFHSSFCTKIVQKGDFSASVANTRVIAEERSTESKNASKHAGAQREDPIVSKKNYILEVTVCQYKNPKKLGRLRAA
jgi:hypothetical protein